MNNLRYIRYSRKSSEAKERQALSITDQNAECDKIIARDDLNVVLRLQESKTSFKPNVRSEFNRMIKNIEEGKANAILTWKPDRLCRNPKEGGALLQLLQDGQLKEIRTAMGDVYTPDSDHLILQIHFGMANQYSRNLSQNVKRGVKRKVYDRKEYPYPAPIGYEGFGERGQRNIRPHIVESRYVKNAFKMASDGLYSLSYICDRLYDEGLRTKKGKRVGKSHLVNILSSPVYYGYILHKGEISEGNFEPLVSKGLFDLAQSKLHDRSRPKKIAWQKEFLSLIRCGNCGCAVTTTFKTKYIKGIKENRTFIYHHCTHRRGSCNEKPVSDQELKAMLYKEIERVSIDKDVWQLGIKLIKAKHSDEMGKLKRQYQYIAQQQTSIREQIDRLIEMRANDELTKQEFIEQKQRLTNKLAAMDNKANDNSHSVKTWLELMEEYFDTAFQVSDIVKFGDFEQKQKVLRKIGENFLLKDKKLVFTFQKPYDALLIPDYRTNVLPSMDSNHDTQLQRLLSYH